MAKKVYVYSYMVLWTDAIGTYMSRTFKRDHYAVLFLNKLLDSGFDDATVEMVEPYRATPIDELEF